MSLDHGTNADEGAQPFDVAFRVTQAMNARKLSPADLARRAGVTVGEVERIMRDDFDSIDQIQVTLQRIECVLESGFGYLTSGSPACESKQLDNRRMKLSAVVEKFCKTMRMGRDASRAFYVWVMRRFDGLLGGDIVGVHSEEVPEAQWQLEEYYREWHQRIDRKRRRHDETTPSTRE